MSVHLEAEKILEVFEVSKSYNLNNPRKLDSGTEKWSIFKEAILGSKRKQFSIPKNFFALQNVSFEVKKSESLGILGLNGSGKSTLLQIIAGTLSPSYGKVCMRGKVAALLELGSGFNPDFTGKENVIINGKILGLTESEIKSKFRSIQDFAEIGKFFYQPVSTYSSGMVLRLAFAVLAHVNPEILIIDEALAVGDPRFQLKCFAFLEEFKSKGGTLIIVSHDLNSIARLCSHSILLHEGCLIAEGKPINVINEYSKILSISTNFTAANETLKSFTKRKQIIEVEQSISKEFSYGGDSAQIKEIKLLNSHNRETQVLQSGEMFTVSFQVYANNKIEKPIYALTLKDTKGQQIYGQNTHFAKITTKDLIKDDKVLVKFVQYCNLNEGDYFISLGVTRFKDNNLEIVHRRYDVLELKIISTDGSFGCANCFSKIEIESGVAPK
ncbi:ABC transporter ATP-binding protein [Opitutales bacterium]|nr:ABC transporter ATP-binding protein [Opitutales bacterium]